MSRRLGEYAAILAVWLVAVLTGSHRHEGPAERATQPRRGRFCDSSLYTFRPAAAKVAP